MANWISGKYRGGLTFPLLAFTLHLSGLACEGQEKKPPPPPEMTMNDARSIRPLPPAGVTVFPATKGEKIEGMVVRWKASPLARIVAYEVFCKNQDGTYKRLKRVKTSEFTDKHATSPTAEYAVASIDIFGNSSRLSAVASAKSSLK